MATLMEIFDALEILSDQVDTLQAACDALSATTLNIADDIWDIPVDDHQISGSTGEALPERVGGGL